MQFGGRAARRDFELALFDDRTERRVENRQLSGRHVERHGAAFARSKLDFAEVDQHARRAGERGGFVVQIQLHRLLGLHATGIGNGDLRINFHKNYCLIP